MPLVSLAPPRPGWQRHFEGWQLAVVSVGIAALGTALVLPRAVIPRELPLPVVDRREQSRALERDEARVRAAEKTPLPYLVRAAGEAFRRLGASETENDRTKLEELGRSFRLAVARARKKHGTEPLLTLRAVQVSLFVRAVRHWTETGEIDDDLRELGGSFSERARKSGWVDGERRLTLADGELAEIFAVRWSSLAGLASTFPFSPSLNDWRIYYRTLIEHPEHTRTNVDERSEISELARYVSALARHDPDYPVVLASGILSLRGGQRQAAAAFLEKYVRAEPLGRWRLRAQNYLADAFVGAVATRSRAP